jgi:molecular chaperone DnaK (HSP70)
VKRLAKSIGISLPKNRYRVFLGKGTIPPVSETKQFVAPLAEINKVRIRILEGDEDQADRNEFLGEIGINGIRLRDDGKAELELEFSLSATGILTIRLSDRIGEAEGMMRFSLSQLRKETHGEVDITSMPVDELAKKINLLEEQMQILKGEIDVRRERG